MTNINLLLNNNKNKNNLNNNKNLFPQENLTPNIKNFPCPLYPLLWKEEKSKNGITKKETKSKLEILFVKLKLINPL